MITKKSMVFRLDKKIFVALDNLRKDEILSLVDELKDKVLFKLNDAFTNYGPGLVDEIHKRGGEIFLDLKFHDIPNTVANYVKAACNLGVYMFNVHCSGGFEMMQTAKETLNVYCVENKLRKPILIGVTVLTSMNEEEFTNLSINNSLVDQVKNLALIAKKAGIDGVVSSPKEVEMIKEACGDDFLVVTPGIRPDWSVADDQKRITTPRDAVKNCSDYLVIGRPIIKAEDYNMSRNEAVDKILDEINN
jgi:orotidine-5'-phosphate decarboxylase